MENNFESNFFTLLELLDLASRLEVEAVCTRLTVPAHQIVCAQGSKSDSVYIVASGLVEAITQSPDGKQTRSLGFMGKGDFFGDLGVMTGQPRLAAIRTCEAATLLRLEKMVFLNLLEKIPKLGAYFCRKLARRLHKTSTEAHLSVYALDLAGNLRHFDLLTIFQAITSTGRSGELDLHNTGNELIGSFFFRKGRAEYARFVHLEGVEAIWEGFLQSATEGTFTFEVTPEPRVPFNEEGRIHFDSTDLLMQGAMHRDAYQAIPFSLRRMEGRLGRVAELLTWREVETQDLAKRIWDLIGKRPQPLASLWRRINHSSVAFLQAVTQLVATGQAELLPAAPPEEKPS